MVTARKSSAKKVASKSATSAYEDGTSNGRKTSNNSKRQSRSRSRFNIHASVVFQLGESLISDPGQALVELVKNSYDADADYADVSVHTSQAVPSYSKYPKASGYIAISDDGVGMDLETIRRGWLTISDSPKRSLKRNKKVTGKGRTPLGDKGLGRLGTQRLGDNIEILTTPEGSNVRYHVSFSWKDFQNKNVVSQIPVSIQKVHSTEQGTTLLISDLKDIEYWKKSARDLQGELAQLISPYPEGREFIVLTSVDDTPIDLISFSENVRDTSHVRYKLTFDGKILVIEGKIRIDFFRPEAQLERMQFCNPPQFRTNHK